MRGPLFVKEPDQFKDGSFKLDGIVFSCNFSCEALKVASSITHRPLAKRLEN